MPQDVQKADQKMTTVLISIPIQWVNQIDIIAEFYCKSRMNFIRDFIHQGIKSSTEDYQSSIKGLQDMNRVFEEMTKKTAKMKADRDERDSGW